MIQYVRWEDKLKAGMNVKAASILLSIGANNSYVSTKNKPEAFSFGFVCEKIPIFSFSFHCAQRRPCKQKGSSMRFASRSA